ncbi:hypothetical protein H4582DRAFT_2081388 [Lactarius indigo]|nr:hypothetical protein H4582DRAFT_2081388 [Lactarius indigo]
MSAYTTTGTLIVLRLTSHSNDMLSLCTHAPSPISLLTVTCVVRCLMHIRVEFSFAAAAARKSGPTPRSANGAGDHVVMGLTSPILYVLTDFVNINHVLARAADLPSALISRLKKRETAPSEERAFLERLVDILGETRQRGTAYHYKPAHFRSLGPASQGAGPATLGAIAIVFCSTPRSHRPPAGSCAVLHWLFKFSPWFS